MVVCEQLLLVGVEPLGGLAIDSSVVKNGDLRCIFQIIPEMLDPALLILRLFIVTLSGRFQNQTATQLRTLRLFGVAPAVTVAVGDAIADDQDAVDLPGAESDAKARVSLGRGRLYSDCGQRLQLALKVIGIADTLGFALGKGILQRGDLGLQGIQPLIAAAGGAW